MDYVAFLTKLYTLLASAGTKIPEVLAKLQQLVTDLQDPAGLAYFRKIEADLQDITGVVIGKTLAISHNAPNPAFAASLEGHIADLVQTHGGHGAPKGPVLDIIKQLWAAVQNNPALMTMLMSLLTSLFKK